MGFEIFPSVLVGWFAFPSAAVDLEYPSFENYVVGVVEGVFVGVRVVGSGGILPTILNPLEQGFKVRGYIPRLF